jgi:hypothetical protein
MMFRVIGIKKINSGLSSSGVSNGDEEGIGKQYKTRSFLVCAPHQISFG